MKLPEQLPTDPEEIERLYHEYTQDVENFDEAEFRRIMDARLAVWGIDPRQMTAEQIFGAMSESMNSMLLNLYSAKDEAPDEEAGQQVDEIIRMAEDLREQIAVAMRDAGVKGDAGIKGDAGVKGDADVKSDASAQSDTSAQDNSAA